MRPYEVTVAYPDRAERRGEVERWLDGLRAEPGIAHVSVRTVNDLGALAVVFLEEGHAVEPTLLGALHRLSLSAPGCAVAIRAAAEPHRNTTERTRP